MKLLSDADKRRLRAKCENRPNDICDYWHFTASDGVITSYPYRHTLIALLDEIDDLRKTLAISEQTRRYTGVAPEEESALLLVLWENDEAEKASA